jgi:ParB family transcriptional regulator, chromosome partitioning protein
MNAQEAQRVELLAIHEIRIANPRSRQKKAFQSIVSNVDNVGLKKPVTVTRRSRASDGTEFDLVCGQGRIEAILALGGSMVPAVVIEASAEERQLMSLVENIARSRPSHTELIREVRSLLGRGYSSTEISEKLGMHRTYIHDVVRLVKKGEDDLVARVESGLLPVAVAVKIAVASDADVQQALNQAYESGELRGAKFQTAQALVARRSGKHKTSASGKKVSGMDIVREYEKQTARQRALVQRATIVAQRLALLTSSLKQLLADEGFATLLRAEHLDTMPQQLASRMG